jgi:hypothetical protein
LLDQRDNRRTLLQCCGHEGEQQVRWQVLEWNELAINFYKKFPVTFDGEWINCKVYKNEIEKY